MHHDRRTQTPLRPLNIDFTNTAQFDTRSAPPSGDPGSGVSQMTVPGGASVRVKDSAGTSLALNLGIDPVHGTPLLSGQAITAQGDILEVHPCSCKDPIASRHNLPMRGSPALSRSKLLFRDNNAYPSPNSLSRIHHTPGPARNRSPLVLIQTQMPSSPYATELLQELEIPAAAPGTNANLGGLITPTPASVRRTTRSSSTGATYHTTPEYLEEPSTPPPPQVNSSSSQLDLPPKLDPIPTQSTFEPDLEMPTVSSPSSIGPFSGISEPSAISPLLSLPTPFSDLSPENSPCTVLAFPRSVTDVQQNRTPTASSFNRPSSRGEAPQDGGLNVAEVTPPGQSEGTVHSANDSTAGRRDVPMTTGVAADQPLDRDPAPSESKTGLTSDLYTDRPVVRVRMPAAMAEPDGEELQYDLTAQSEPRPSMTELGGSSSRKAPLHGEIKGTWIANQERDHVALKLDLNLIKLGLQNLSLSSPGPMSPGAGARPGPSAAHRTPEDEGGSDGDSSSCLSVESLGSCPSTAPSLSDLPLTPIPELLSTPTKYNTSFTDAALATMPMPEPPYSHNPAYPGEKRQHLVSRLPAPLDNGPIVAQLGQGENAIRTIRTTLHNLANEWQGAVIMPDGVALRDVEDDCMALYHSLVDLIPIIVLTWPPGRQPSLGTEGGQPPAHEQQLHLDHMGETGHKWYLKQHEFTTSLQRNLSRLTLLARRVDENPDAAYRGNLLERISQFTEKFEDLALRLKLAHHIRIEQKCLARVRHAARRAVASPEQVSAYEYHKANLAKVRQDIKEIARDALRRRQWR